MDGRPQLRRPLRVVSLMTNRRAVAFPAVALALTGLFVAGCDSAPRHAPAPPARTASAVEAVADLPVAPSPPGELWIVPHDCAPGAPPASIAAAFDVFKLRCEPERAAKVRGAATVAALATRAGALRGTAGRSAGRAAGAGAAAARIGDGGGSVTSGYSTSDVARIALRGDGAYEVTMTDGNAFVVDQIRISDPRYSTSGPPAYEEE